MSGEFDDWDRQNPKTWIAQGYIDLEDNVSFRIEADAASSLGKHYEGLQLKPGVERSGTPGSLKYGHRAREVGDSVVIRSNLDELSHASRAWFL